MEPTTPELIAPNYKELPEPEVKKGSHWITILAMALFVVASLSVVAFLYYQNQALKKMLAKDQNTSTSPTTIKPKADRKSYINEEYGFSFIMPDGIGNYLLPEKNGKVFFGNQEGIDASKKDGVYGQFLAKVTISFIPKEKVYEAKNTDVTTEQIIKDTVNIDNRKSIRYTHILVDSRNYTSAIFSNIEIPMKGGYLLIEGDDSSFSEGFNQILSTFKFLEASPAPGTKACTQEAKLCPDGSYVGRTGPSCEFAPCP